MGGWAYAEGPQCFGGCMDLCTTTTFGVNPMKTGSNKTNGLPGGQMASIQKDKPQGCKGLCMAVCSDVDTYKVTFNDPKLNPIQRAAVLAETVHLDYMFFESDRDFCEVDDNGDGSGVIYITMCTAYVRGALIPIQSCIPYNSNGG